MHQKFNLALLAFLLFISCRTVISTTAPAPSQQISTAITAQDHQIQAVLWTQQAAEYRALTYQAYNLAKLRLDEILAQENTAGKPLAIVTDIDETVLDNSPYNGKLILTGEEFTDEGWYDWGKQIKAEPVPGALAFFNYAASRGVSIFYISNRDAVQQAETLANLKQAGFPMADEAHILLKTTTSGKEIRRNKVAETHEIVMLLGDNLSDFTNVFDRQGTEKRYALTDSLQPFFGKIFIVLPNAIYGDWETKGIFEGRYDWTAKQQDSIRRKKVEGY
ncbi:MAG: 5'-nucleotidase, lipoprotein e(P4) family [Aureibaculum sp.]